MSDEIFWGPWVEHDGRGCPCVGRLTEAAFSDGRTEIDTPLASVNNPPTGWCSPWLWATIPEHMKFQCIRRYRVRRNPSTTAAVEALKAMARNPERVREGVINEVVPYFPSDAKPDPVFR